MEQPVAKILVVDDNEANRSLARSTLEDEGYEVVVATGGVEGLALFEREHPDCVLLDVRMPGLDGFAVCERIRATPEGAETPVLFLTALRDVDTFDRALHVGGADFLTKPVRPTELVVRVQSALKLRRLAGELRDQYEVFRQQRDGLLRLQLQKERLMAFVVHDLKNPVNSLDLYAQLLLRDQSLSATARESAAQIRAEARQLNRMILNLLDLARADEGQLQPARAAVAIAPVVDGVLAELGVVADRRGVALEKSVDAEQAYLDVDLVRRMLTNLVENAIRHAPAGSTITVSAVRQGNAVELRVRDAGRGVPAEMREKVFDPFVQLETGGKVVAQGNRGLGLAFCRSTVVAHGGRIWVEDAAPGAVLCARFPDAE